MAGFYSVSRSSCVCTLVTLPTCSIWSAFASLRGIFDNEHGSLAVAHFGREGGNAPPLSQVFGMWHDAEAFMFFHRADCYSARSLYLPGCLSSLGSLLSFGRTNFWSAERTCTALALSKFQTDTTCAVL